jgi:hypothetical protein
MTLPIVSIVAHRHEIRVTLLLVNLALLILLVTTGTLTPVPKPTAQEIYNELASVPVTPESIFLHNIMICLVEIIPLLGTLMLVLSGFTTGLGLSAISLITGANPAADLWLLLNQYPHTWFEFLAYSLAATEGTMAFLMLIAVGFRLLFRRELKILVLTFVVCNLLLATGSVFEIVAIVGGNLAVAATWIISGVVLVAATYYDAKRRGMRLPNPLIPLALVEVGTIIGYALPTLLAFALLLWMKHVKHKGVRQEIERRSSAGLTTRSSENEPQTKKGESRSECTYLPRFLPLILPKRNMITKISTAFPIKLIVVRLSRSWLTVYA